MRGTPSRRQSGAPKMSDTIDLADRIEDVRQRTISLLDRIGAQGRTDGLPAPPPAIDQLRQKLVENSYNVLVVGEAKRGKSSFVNALIGRDLLPTDVDIATSQVFRVQQATDDAFRVRFEDDSTRDIDVDDLPRYGSQVLADVEGLPLLNQIIRWIELDLPVRFLPPGVRLLDTPGLGSLYAAHAQITQRFIPRADAVIFVLDSSGPIGQVELAFVETILSTTASIFFVQTKIDLYRRDDWRAIQRRNEALLAERFGDCLTDPRVWPPSSKNLLQAVQTGDDDFLPVSRYPELLPALQAFLFRAAGWSRCGEALVLAERYHALTMLALEERRAGLVDASDEERGELQRLVAERKQRFDADWGAHGQRRDWLLAGVAQVSASGRDAFERALQPNGPIAAAYAARIDAVTALDAADRLAMAMPEEIIAATLDRWARIADHIRHQHVTHLAHFDAAVDALSLPPTKDAVAIERELGSSLFLARRWAGRLRGERADGDRGITLAKHAVEILIVVGLIPTPLTAVAAVAAVLFSAAHLIHLQKRQIDAAREELRRQLAAVLRDAHAAFLVPTADGLNVIDGYLATLERAVHEQVERVAARKSAEAQAELIRLAEEANLDEHERTARVAPLERQRSAWQSIGGEVRALGDDLDALDKATSLVPATRDQRTTTRSPA